LLQIFEIHIMNMEHTVSPNVVDGFLYSFTFQLETFRTIVNRAEGIIDASLAREHIQYHLTHRIKNRQSAANKIYDKEKERGTPYQNFLEIRNDTVDLIGLRVELFDWNNVESVSEVIAENFDIIPLEDGNWRNVKYKESEAPHARHFRVYLRDPHYSAEVIEIQVCSLLMAHIQKFTHSSYKKKRALSEKEKELLDDLEAKLHGAAEVILKLTELQRENISAKQQEVQNAKDTIPLKEFLDNFDPQTYTENITHRVQLYEVQRDLQAIDRLLKRPFASKLNIAENWGLDPPVEKEVEALFGSKEELSSSRYKKLYEAIHNHMISLHKRAL
jgi:ppGpp synthetase/RelA/SpoT-type nucleotidyltranferase